MPTDLEILFHGFSKARRQAFLELGAPERHGARSAILREGAGGSDMLIVQDGIVSVWVRDVKVNEVRMESVLGASSLIEPHPRTASLIAETEVALLRFTRPKVLEFLETVPPRVFHQFFVNAFHIHMNLVSRCEERIVRLSQELSAI